MIPRSARFAFALSFCALACGGGQHEPAPPATPSGAPAASAAPVASATPTASAAPSATAPAGPAAPPKDGEWDTWSHDQKLAYMKSTVLPKMGPLFHEVDPKAYAEPKCVLCHGSGAKDATFKMPNPDLPKLDLTPAGMKQLREKKPAMVEFMSKTVVPTMAALVGEKPYDPKTQKGFGCLECHTKK
jgi:hypothetical protein